MTQSEINDIQYLKINVDYNNDYTLYKDKKILNLGYSENYELINETGKIIEIENYLFTYDIPSPSIKPYSFILLFDSLTIVGIHKNIDNKTRLKVGIL